MVNAPGIRPDVHIRAAMPADIASMIEVVNAAFAIETFLDGTRTDDERIGEMQRKGEFLVAESHSGRIVACVYLERHTQCGYFGMLAVDPPWQGKRLGRAMVDAAESCCRESGCTEMNISVLSLRPELLPFYRGLGYSHIRTEAFRPSRPLKKGVACQSLILTKKL